MALDDAQGSGRQDRDHEMTNGQGSSLTYAVLKQPTLGWVTNNGDGTFSFDPGTDFRDLGAGETRQVSFNYQASDGWGGTEAACAIVTVTGAADGTLAIDVSYGGTLEYDGAQPSHVMLDDAPGAGARPGPSAPPLVGAPESDATAAHGPATPEGPETRNDATPGETAGGLAPTHREMDAHPAEVPSYGFGQDPGYSAPPVGSNTPRYTVLAQPSEGRVHPKEDGTFDFLPDPDFPELAVGELYQVTFTCQASDGGGETSTVIAALTVAGTNDGPEACDVSFRLAQGAATPQQDAVVGTGKNGSTSGAPDVNEAVRVDSSSRTGSGTTTGEEPPGAAVPAVDTAAPPEHGDVIAGSAPLEGLPGMADAFPDLVEEESASVGVDPNPAAAPAGSELQERPDRGGIPDSLAPAPADLGSSARPAPVRDEPPPPAAGAELRERPEPGVIPESPIPAPADPGSSPRPAPIRNEPPPPAAGAELRERPEPGVIPESPTPAPAGPGSSPRPAPIRNEPPPPAAGTEIQEQLGSGGISDDPAPAPADLGSSPRPAPVRDESPPPAASAELRERPEPGVIPESPIPEPADPGSSPRPAPVRNEPPPPAARTEIQERLGPGGIPDGPAPAPADPRSSPRPAAANAHVPDGDATVPAEDTAVGPAGLTDFTLSNDAVSEKCEPGTLVGQVVVAGAVDTGGFIYDLQRDAGGRFDINPRTGKITIADGARLDHGAEASHDILIQVIDGSGVSCRKTCTIKILPAEPIQGIGHDAGTPEIGPQAADVPDIPAQGNEAPDPALGGAEVWGDRPGEAGEPAPMGGVGEVQEESGGRRHDTLRLDGVTGGPGTGGWSLDLTEGVVVANSGDHILLSGNSAGSIALDGTAVKVAFRGIERVEW